MIPGERPSDFGHLLALLNGQTGFVPDFLNDLNAIHSAKQILLTNFELCNTFNHTLLDEGPTRSEVVHEIDKWTWGQSAKVQSRALVKTLGLWVETETPS